MQVALSDNSILPGVKKLSNHQQQVQKVSWEFERFGEIAFFLQVASNSAEVFPLSIQMRH